MPKMRKSQLGTPSSGNYSGKRGRSIGNVKAPWATYLGFKGPLKKPIGASVTKQARPSKSESPQTQGYPRNQPDQWPVEPDFAGHTLPPPLSGLTDAAIAINNATVEQAYTRAGYQ